MNDDDYSDIKEVPIYTEKELDKEYDAVNNLLIDTSSLSPDQVFNFS
jgi:hypothetical protein